MENNIIRAIPGATSMMDTGMIVDTIIGTATIMIAITKRYPTDATTIGMAISTYPLTATALTGIVTPKWSTMIRATTGMFTTIKVVTVRGIPININAGGGKDKFVDPQISK